MAAVRRLRHDVAGKGGSTRRSRLTLGIGESGAAGGVVHRPFCNLPRLCRFVTISTLFAVHPRLTGLPIPVGSRAAADGREIATRRPCAFYPYGYSSS